MELCHSVVETSVGWFKEQQNKPAEDREATSSHLMVEEQPLAQVALNSYFPTDVGHGESRACGLQGLKLCCLRKKSSQKKLCRQLFVVQGKTCLGELGQICCFPSHKMERELHRKDSLLSFTKCICDHFFTCCQPKCLRTAPA